MYLFYANINRFVVRTIIDFTHCYKWNNYFGSIVNRTRNRSLLLFYYFLGSIPLVPSKKTWIVASSTSEECLHGHFSTLNEFFLWGKNKLVMCCICCFCLQICKLGEDWYPRLSLAYVVVWKSINLCAKVMFFEGKEKYHNDILLQIKVNFLDCANNFCRLVCTDSSKKVTNIDLLWYCCCFNNLL